MAILAGDITIGRIGIPQSRSTSRIAAYIRDPAPVPIRAGRAPTKAHENAQKLFGGRGTLPNLCRHHQLPGTWSSQSPPRPYNAAAPTLVGAELTAA
jgi:hypothetical protein